LRFTLPTDADQDVPEKNITWGELDRCFPPRDASPPLGEFERRRRGLTIEASGLRGVTVVRVECFFERPFGAADFAGLAESRDEPVFDAARDALLDACHAAREGLRALLETISRARATGSAPTPVRREAWRTANSLTWTPARRGGVPRGGVPESESGAPPST
jgi:hypothetical protein